MLVSMVTMQAHGVVPHHHHDAEAPHHGHVVDPHLGFASLPAEGSIIDDLHPEVAPHDEPSLGTIRPSHRQQCDLDLAMPTPIEVVFSDEQSGTKRHITPCGHPFATGPPSTKSSRAPPASLTA